MILNKTKCFLSFIGIVIILFFTGCENNDILNVKSGITTINKVVSKSEEIVFVSGKNMVLEVLLADKPLLEEEVYVEINISGIKKPLILQFEDAQSKVSQRVLYPENINSFVELVKVEKPMYEENKSIFKISITTDKGFFSYAKEDIRMNITRLILKSQKYVNRYTKECNNKNTESCVRLADMYYKGVDIKQNSKRAKKILLKACTLDNAKACNNLAWIEESEKNFDKAHKFYTMACSKNHKMACSNLGFLYENATGVKRDIQKAKKLYKEACDAGQKIACSNLKELNKKEKEIRKDKVEVEKEEKECMNKDSKSCAYLGVRYFNGTGVFKNLKKAREFYEKGCDGGNMMSCSNLGLMYATGKGVKRDKEKSIKLLTKACKIGNSITVCDNLESVKNNREIYYWLLKTTEESSL